MIRTCSDFPDAPCCDSCHEDEWYGFDLLEFGDDYANPHTTVCCGVAHWAKGRGIDLDATPENVECQTCGDQRWVSEAEHSPGCEGVYCEQMCPIQVQAPCPDCPTPENVEEPT